jgi:hypothetical protein
MRKSTLLAAVATAVAAAIITPSLSQAQDTTQKTSKGEVAMAPSFGSLISAINSTAAKTDKIKGMTEVNAANVQLVNVDDVLKGQKADALNEALKKNEADITALRTALGANTGIAGVLTANAVPLAPTDVIAADVGGDGRLTLYYWKKTS